MDGEQIASAFLAADHVARRKSRTICSRGQLSEVRICLSRTLAVRSCGRVCEAIARAARANPQHALNRMFRINAGGTCADIRWKPNALDSAPTSAARSWRSGSTGNSSGVRWDYPWSTRRHRSCDPRIPWLSEFRRGTSRPGWLFPGRGRPMLRGRAAGVWPPPFQRRTAGLGKRPVAQPRMHGLAAIKLVRSFAMRPPLIVGSTSGKSNFSCSIMAAGGRTKRTAAALSGATHAVPIQGIAAPLH